MAPNRTTPAHPVERTEPLGFLLAAHALAANMALDQVRALLRRQDVATLPPHTRHEVVAMLRDIAATAAELAERLEAIGT
jgi:hypothetical protein